MTVGNTHPCVQRYQLSHPQRNVKIAVAVVNQIKIEKSNRVDSNYYKSRCPCFNAKKKCSECLCSGCANPLGKRVQTSTHHSRVRQNSQIDTKRQPGFTYMASKGESPSQGKWSESESLLLYTLLEKDTDVSVLLENYNRHAQMLSNSFMLVRQKSFSQISAHCKISSLLRSKKKLMGSKILLPTRITTLSV